MMPETFFPKQGALTLLLCIFFLPLNAQKPPMKWGKVDEKDLNMATCETDTSAAAVLLCDYAELSVDLGDGDLRYVFEHHRRIKILKRPGFAYADVSIPFHESEAIGNLDAQLFTPDGQVYALTNNDIFEEESSEQWSQMKFSFPKVEEGAVIEYRYRISSESVVQLRPWYFQREIPTLWSELRLSIPEWYDYIFLTQGRPMDIEERDSREESIRVPSGSGISGFVRAEVNKYRFVMEDVPAMTEEAYVTTMDDYLARVRFQLRSVRYPNSLAQPVLSNWAGLAKELNESGQLGKQIDKRKNQKALLEALEPVWAEAGAESKEERAMLAYQYLNNVVEWDGRYSFFADEDLADCFEKKKGSSGELNLMMLCVFNALEIEAYPVLSSTRDHGSMLELYPILSQFNHLMALANLNGQMQLFDLGSPARPPGYPRVSALNGRGWLADESGSQWLQLAPPGGQIKSMYNVELDSQGNAAVSVATLYEGYDAVDLREALREDDKGQFLASNWKDRYPEVQIGTPEFEEGEHPFAPLKATYDGQLPGLAQAFDDFLYVSIALMPAFKENPLKLEERTYPVEIPYPIKVQDVLFIEIPEGYSTEELPESVRVYLPNDGGKFDCMISENGGKVQVISKIEINQLTFKPEEYPVIRNFFNYILEKQDEQIVFRKKT